MRTAVGRFGATALAWEVLRRQPEYRAAYASFVSSQKTPATVPGDFVTRWGLHFR